MAKTPRNALCPCGSQKKYKKCCGALSPQPLPFGFSLQADSAFQQRSRQLEAVKIQREKQQGLGKGIISTDWNGKRVVAVGNKMFVSDQWKTFHDFLFRYLVDVLGPGWFEAETAKSPEARHPIVRWRDLTVAAFEATTASSNGIATGRMTGAQRAFLNLAYNFYLIAHHACPREAEKLVRKFTSRVKSSRSDAFTGAVFETYAAAAFLRAGFELRYEDESDGRFSHVEFTATSLVTGKKLSVEVKARNPTLPEDGQIDDIRRLRVANKLNKALSKRAEHTRVVLIEINIADVVEDASLSGWRKEALEQIRFAERSNAPDGQEKPSAYVIVRNHAFHNNLLECGAGLEVLAAGCRIPDFGPGLSISRFKELLEWKEKHREILALLDSMRTHYEIPATFDGSIPELAFANAHDPPRLKIGDIYEIPAHDGRMVPARLIDATVSEHDRRAVGTYQTSDGQYFLAEVPLTVPEITAWKRHPETFFGEFRHVGGKVNNWLELAEFMYETYKDTDREKLLEWMQSAADFDYLERLPQEELAILFCERCAFMSFSKNQAA